MKRIDQHNCEAWFLDYYEGRLSADEITRLKQFLAAHPEWEDDFAAFDTEVSVVTDDGEGLDTDTRLNLYATDDDDDLIALSEGILSADESDRVEESLKNDQKRALRFKQYQIARMTPDTAVRFPHKSSLKKSAPVVVLFQRYAAVAALMATAFIAVWLMWPKPDIQPMAEQVVPQTTLSPEAGSNVRTAVEHPNPTNPPSATNASKAGELDDAPRVTPNTVRSEKNIRDSERSPSIEPKTVVNRSGPETQRPQPTTIARLSPAGVPAVALAQSKPQLKTPNLIAGRIDFPAEPSAAGSEEREPGRSGGFVAGLLSNIGNALSKRIKESAGDQVVIEQNDVPDDNLVTSTFRIGSFEVYRSRTK